MKSIEVHYYAILRDQAGRRALHVHLPRPDANQLGRVFDGLLRGLSADA